MRIKSNCLVNAVYEQKAEYKTFEILSSPWKILKFRP